MSVGGLSIEVKEPVHSAEKKYSAEQKRPVEQMSDKVWMKEADKILSRDDTCASIDPSRCVNCGTCREICPEGAIQEMQRPICHTCPLCTDKPTLSPQAVDDMATACSCTTACPLHISPQGYIGLVKAGKPDEAFSLIWNKNPLPSVCGSVCHHPCEDACKRGLLVDSPMKIRALKKYLSVNEDVPVKKYQRIYDETVAVVGAGPSGLTAAHYLSLMGYEVTVFEQSGEIGGMLKQGIPSFRLDRSMVDRDVKRLQDSGLEIRLNQRIDKAGIEQLRRDYDVVLAASGNPVSKELHLDGWRLAGVMPALSYMRQVNHGYDVERHLGQIFNYKGGEAVIIGGGSVAMDTARTAVREGASKVTVVSLESGDMIPAHPWEVEEAKEEGIRMLEGYSPVEFLSDLYPTLSGVKFAKVTKFEKDENGRIHFETDPEDTIVLKADWAIQAIGQAPDGFWNDYRDQKDVVFTGDISGGPCSVVDAMAKGREAAIKIHEGFRGIRIKEEMERQELHLAPVEEKIFPYNRLKIGRPVISTAAPEVRVHNFDEVEGILDGDQAELEVQACLKCGYEQVDPEKCIACGNCQRVCPKGDVITMVSKKK